MPLKTSPCEWDRTLTRVESVDDAGNPLGIVFFERREPGPEPEQEPTPGPSPVSGGRDGRRTSNVWVVIAAAMFVAGAVVLVLAG